MTRVGRIAKSRANQVSRQVGSTLPRPTRLNLRPPLGRSHHAPGDSNQGSSWHAKLLEGLSMALGSVAVVGLVGYGYNWYYKSLVLRKMETAFSAGYSSLEQAALARQSSASGQEKLELADVEDGNWIPRTEQALIDKIVDGTVAGNYHLICGERGTGKTSMLLEATRKVNGEGVATMEAHGDLEVFRLRLGKALNYEFHEDYIGSLFSFKGPRDATPLLDIERAFNKMEKIALKRRETVGRPLVLIINRAHLLRDDDEGRHLLDVIQQRAELWAVSKLVTIVFNSDEYWIEERLNPQALRLRVTPVHDIPQNVAIAALKNFRSKLFHEDVPLNILEQVYAKVGGRLRFLSLVAKSEDMLKTCELLYEKERRWFLNKCWIYGNEMDDDAEDDQEFCAAAMVLAKALVEKEESSFGELSNPDKPTPLPYVELHRARQIMTRADFIQRLDRINIFTIDTDATVRADSVIMQKVFHDICTNEGFNEHLEATLERLDELEGLGRTSEVTFKDLNGGGGYQATIDKDASGRKGVFVSLKPPSS